MYKCLIWLCLLIKFLITEYFNMKMINQKKKKKKK